MGVMPNYLAVVASSLVVALVVVLDTSLVVALVVVVVVDSSLVVALVVVDSSLVVDSSTQGFASEDVVLGIHSEVALGVALYSEDKTHKMRL